MVGSGKWEGGERKKAACEYVDKMGGLTLFKFPNNLAYSSKTSCSSGLRLSSPSDVCEAPKFCSALDAGAGSEAMVCFSFFFSCMKLV